MHSDELWKRVLARDPSADGRFVYAVRSTGVYCRPTCPSRRPLRRNVQFFEDAVRAERAGFRPCRRCHGRPQPDWPRLVRQACELLAGDVRLTLADVAGRLHVGPFQLQRHFKSVLGITPRDFAAAGRTRRLKALLARREPVASALYEAGYGSSSRLYEQADAELGMTPATYRRGGAAMQIHYTVVPSPLGRLLVAATERGVCSIKLGDSAPALVEDLRREYPRATLEGDLGKLSPAVTSLRDYLAGDRARVDLPLDVQGTAFQRRVWNYLRRIPFGQTKSYGEIARALGQPGAARAVAQACGSNHAALVIPCHRVVQGDGGPGGYHWGAERKKKLLELERNSQPRG
jgi:AraC family transcriptional regulator, regulatory protein of adaptative response / methylated-DNA-[protein]-cysteine methyltransferase